MSKLNPAEAGSNEIQSPNDKKELFDFWIFGIDLTFGF
jgi:hypothetical protein